MFQQYALHLVILFVIRQIAKFGAQVKWPKIKEDWDVRVRALVPGLWFDDDAVALANILIDACGRAVADTVDLQKILDLCAAKKWDEAASALKAMVLTIWSPVTADGQKLYALLAPEPPHAGQVGEEAPAVEPTHLDHEVA